MHPHLRAGSKPVLDIGSTVLRKATLKVKLGNVCPFFGLVPLGQLSHMFWLVTDANAVTPRNYLIIGCCAGRHHAKYISAKPWTC